VLVHDPIDNYTNPECGGSAHDQTLEQLRACDYAYWFSPSQFATRADERHRHPLRGTGVVMPTLTELLAETAARPDGAGLLLEIKHTTGQNTNDPDGTEVAHRTVAAVVEAGLVDRTVVLSFSQVVLDAVKREEPTLRTAPLGPLAGPVLAHVLASGHDIAATSVTAPDFDEDFVARAHEAGVAVMPYTVDQVADLREVVRIGVDGVITNHPGCLLRLLGRPTPDSVVAPELAARGVAYQPPCYGSGSVPLNHPSAFGAVYRVGGEDRFATAAALARDAAPDGAPRVLLARGDVAADALAASALVGGAPLLLTAPDGLPAATAAAFDDLGAEEVVVLGGPAAISQRVTDVLTAAGLDVSRIAGADRFATAAAVARELGRAGTLAMHGESATTAVLASGLVEADALAAGPLAAEAGLPVLLTGPDRLAPSAAAALDSAQVRRVLLAGGPDAVGARVEDELRARGLQVVRVAGSDRTGTAAALAALTVEALGWDAQRVDVAAASAVPDALAAVAHAADDRVPLLFSASATDLGVAAEAFLAERCDRVAEVVLVGGETVTGGEVARAASAAAICPVPSALDLVPSSDSGPTELRVTLADQLGRAAPGIQLVVELARPTMDGRVPVGRQVITTGTDGAAVVPVDPAGSDLEVTVCRPRQSEDPCRMRDPDTDPQRGPIRQAFQGPPVPLAVASVAAAP